MRTAAFWIIVMCLAGAQSSFMLKDQYGNEKTVGAPSTDWTLLIYGDRVGGDYSSIWGKGLKAKALPNCRIAFAADLKSVPFFLKGTIANKFLGKGPDGKNKGPILLDWEGQIGRAFGFTSSVANVYAFDPTGNMRARAAGKGGEGEVDRFATTVFSLMHPPVP
jgi:hypothetical protein